MLRNSADDEFQRARQCAIYGIVGYASVPLAYISSRLVFSLHPESIGLTSTMNLTAIIMTAGLFLLYFYLLWFNMKIEKFSRIMRSGQ